jgi:hypothetical protein
MVLRAEDRVLRKTPTQDSALFSGGLRALVAEDLTLDG